MECSSNKKGSSSKCSKQSNLSKVDHPQEAQPGTTANDDANDITFDQNRDPNQQNPPPTGHLSADTESPNDNSMIITGECSQF